LAKTQAEDRGGDDRCFSIENEKMSHFEKFYLETNEFSGCEGMGVGIQTKRGMRWVFQDFFDAAGSSFMISEVQ
jgi:hypothetical protein